VRRPIGRLINELDHAEFVRVRTRTGSWNSWATRGPGECKQRSQQLSAEARARIERIIADREGGSANSDEGLRLLRTVEVLERIGNAEARALLAVMAKNAPSPEPVQRARPHCNASKQNDHVRTGCWKRVTSYRCEAVSFTCFFYNRVTCREPGGAADYLRH